MRRAKATEQARLDMGTRSGLNDPELIQELADLGFTTDTVALLPLTPLIQIAWAGGGVSDAERRLIVELARSRGIVEGDAADRQLSVWLTTCPAEEVFARATRLIRAMLASPGQTGLTTGDLVKYCEGIAAASGGIFGLNRISSDERTLLSQIVSDLKAR